MASKKAERLMKKNQLLAGRSALKAEKALQAQEQARRKARMEASLAKAKEEAETSRRALETQETALREKEDVLTRELAPETEDGEGLGARLRVGFAKTRDAFSAGLARVVLGKKEIDAELMSKLEEMLITSDVGVTTTARLLDAINAKARRVETREADKLLEILRVEIRRVLSRGYQAAENLSGHKPAVALFVGVNGTGKTTTIGKFAAQAVGRGEKVLLAAGDTFRAAAAEQLSGWAERAHCEIFAREPGADPSGVMHQALQKGVKEGFDLVLCDTAGRLHTKSNLMEELKKIRRVISGVVPGAPHETYLVLDGNTGQNAVLQTRQFHEVLGLTGLVITKLDGTARGGVVVGIVNEFDIPVRYVGVGEGVNDLQPFSPESFVEALLG